MKTDANPLRVAFLALLCLSLSMPVLAEHSDYTPPPADLEDEQGERVYYDYHAGVIYSGILQNFLYRHVDNLVREQDVVLPEPTQRR